ncbi:MFS transporter [Halobaculum sp. MBLA0147]|uniref:MFS transporter n=1 Tax=Halobaculum sp. MBLA0147 TaxID=3079934 RepID=UPI0035242FD5
MGVLDTDRRVFALAFARMADSLGNSFLIVVLPSYVASVVGEGGAEVAGASLSTTLLIGIVLSLFGFLNSGLQPLTGRLSDRFGRRRAFVLAGLAVLGVGSAGYPFADSYAALAGLRALQGIGAALTIPATVALVNEVGDAAERGGNFGVFNTFRLIGFGVGPLVAGGVKEAYGFDTAFAVAVVGAALGFLLVVLLVEDPTETRAAAADDVELSVTGDDTLLDPVFTLGVATVVMAMGIALFATLEGQINERLNQTTFLFGVQFGAAVLANVVFQIPIGNASDRYGRRLFVLGGLVLLIPSTLVQGFVTTSVGMIVARTVQGLAVALVFPVSLALAGDLAGEGQSGSTLSILTTGFGLGTAIGPLVSGVLAGIGYVAPFAFVAGLGVLALVLVYTQVSDPDAGDEPPEPAADPTPRE